MSDTRQSAIVVVFDPEGNTLVLRRGPTDPWKPGHWNFPGGKVDPGEAVQQAAVRELAEEAGVYVPRSSLQHAFSYRGGSRLIHVFLVQLPHRPPVESNDGEHDWAHWCALSAIPEPSIPGVPFIVAQLRGM